MNVHVPPTHSAKCLCFKCQANHCEPELIALEYKRKTGKAVVESVEYTGAGSWIVNYKWIAYAPYGNNSNKGWYTVEQWNKCCNKEETP